MILKQIIIIIHDIFNVTKKFVLYTQIESSVEFLVYATFLVVEIVIFRVEELVGIVFLNAQINREHFMFKIHNCTHMSYIYGPQAN